MDIKLRSDFFIVAKGWNVELYHRHDVESALRAQGESGWVSPIQTIPYPENRGVWRIRILDPRLSSVGDHGHDQITLGAYTPVYSTPPTIEQRKHAGWARWGIRETGSGAFSLTADEDASPYNTSEYSQSVLQVAAGSTLTRIAQVGYKHGYEEAWGPIIIEGLIYPPITRHCPREKWTLPDTTLLDVPRVCDFDEAAGLIACAMTSGRVWVVDAARRRGGEILGAGAFHRLAYY